MKKIKFVSIDSSLANTGVTCGYITSDDKVEVVSIDLVTTEKSKNKKVRAASDTVDRNKTTYDFVHDHVKEWGPKLIFIETPSGSQSSSGMKSYGSTCMLIASLGEAIQVTPEEVKLASVGIKTASKKDMIDWAYNLYPSVTWFWNNKKELQNKNEHMADSIAIAYAGLKTEAYKMIKKFIQ